MMKSLLLEQLARLILPLALILGAALLIKGHDEPGGGFVAGLALAMAAVLRLAVFGSTPQRQTLSAEVFALIGVGLVLASLIVPVVWGDPLLTHASGKVPILGKWHAALLFDVGVTLAVGAGAAAAAKHLWETNVNDPPKPPEGRG